MTTLMPGCMTETATECTGHVARVAICAITLHRPAGLAALLDGLNALIDPEPPVAVEIVIVDNDPAASARAVVEAAPVGHRWPVHYDVEPRRGIPFARNRAVALARDADFVAFIDDDEVPDPHWLAELVRVQRDTGADVVTGPVLPCFAEPPPAWALQGRFYERPRFPTGHRLDYARTSNVLIASPLLAAHPGPFDTRFGLTGGDDTHFFMRAHLAGARIVWADDAIVTETVPASRVTPVWLARRAFRNGSTLSLCLRYLRDSPWRRLRRIGHGALRIAQGLALLASSPVGGRATAIRGVQRAALGAGLIAGLFGRSLDEYRTIHGR
jgi:glycosyltransferase involved in cell wall biosynthesis